MTMKQNNLEQLIRQTIHEIFDVMREEHERGEWWIDESGGTIFADGDVGDSNHEAVVIGNLRHEILSHFGIEEDEPGELADYEESIKESLIADGRLSEEEMLEWDNMGSRGGPVDVIIRKLLEDKVYATPEQANDAVYIAYGSNKDARDYAMQYWRWKVMKTYGGAIEVQTWYLKPDDLGIIVRGVWEIMGEDSDDPEDSDAEIGEDGYPGPRINVTVQATGKRFSDIPLAVLEKKMPQNLHNYQSGAHVGFTERLTEDYHHYHKEYRLFEANRHIVAIFEDNTRLMFEVHYHANRGPDKEKWRHRAFSKWKTIANEIHNNVELNEVGNPMQKTWKQAFKEALEHPELQEFIRKEYHQRIYPQSIDSVNFSKMG